MLTAQTPPAPVSTNPVKRLIRFFLEPRSVDRDERFRERTIRITVAIVAALTLLSVFTSVVIFKDPLTPRSPTTLYLVMLTLSLLSAFAVHTQRLVLAGVFLVLTFLAAAVGVLLVDVAGFEAQGLPTFLLTIIITALVLPRNVIIPLAVVSAILLGGATQLTHPESLGTGSTISSAIFLFVTAGLFLRQLRVEFDNRLAAMAASIQEAEKARHEADEANQAKSQFLANMSHELRTPLNAIIGYTEIMLNGMAGSFTDKQTQLQGFIQINAKRLLALINDILDLAKIESGTIEVLATLAAPRKVIGDAIDGMQSLATNKNIYLKATFDDSMPEMILVDVQKIQQIVTNLVSNAVKFTTEGGVEVKVGSALSNTWQIKVIDTGRGMPADAANYIFESFRQVDSSDSREHKGTGLGLAITKRLIDKLGGTVDVKSEVGKGSTFTVTLPRIGQDIVQRTAEKQPEPVAS